MSGFKRAVKEQLKARVAFEGPTGAGKTWTAMEWATVLADGKPFAVVDTENRSAAYYADKFTFDVLDWPPPYDPGKLAATIKQAAAEYPVIVVDSLTHFWSGEGGTLDIVDAASQRARGNTFAGWKTGTPAIRHLMDMILQSPAHVLVTMRSKMEYVLQDRKSQDGRVTQVPTKVGMAPEMRAGIDYEFTVVCEMNLEHQLTVTKSRCHLIADLMAQPGRAGEMAELFRGWLDEGAEATTPAPIRVTPEPKAEPPQQYEQASTPPEKPAPELPLGATAPHQRVPAENSKGANWHRSVAVLVPDETERRALIWLASAGRTDSANEAKAAERTKAHDWARAIHDGGCGLDISDAGGVRIVALIDPDGNDIERHEQAVEGTP